MGYTIKIGNAELESEWDKEEGGSACWDVPVVSNPDAPMCEFTEQRNERWPSYSGWADFARTTGLYEWCFNYARGSDSPRIEGQPEGKMSRHPGCMPLTQADLLLVQNRLVEFRAKNPDRIPGGCPCPKCEGFLGTREGPPHDPRMSVNLDRLIWLEWWIRWALANCERPAISNG